MRRWVLVLSIIGLVWVAFLVTQERLESGELAVKELGAIHRNAQTSAAGLGALVVQHRGRLRPLGAFARDIVEAITGDARAVGVEQVLVVLSWTLCPEEWASVPILKVAPRFVEESGITGNRVGKITRASPKDISEALANSEKKGPGARRAAMRLAKFNSLARDLKMLPSPQSSDWVELGGAGSEAYPDIASSMHLMTEALKSRDAERFREAAGLLQTAVLAAAGRKYPAGWRLRLELLHAKLDPVGGLSILYLLTGILYGLSLLRVPGFRLARPGSIFLTICVAVHALVVGWRSLVAQRFMASNTYEYVLLATIVTGVVALRLQVSRREALFGFLGTTLSGLALGLVVLSPISGKVSPLVPVLQSEWLRYHVGAAAIAYGLLYLSFGLALSYFILFARASAEQRAWVYGIILRLIRIGFFFLTLGIITGAVWADRAWGRYWGWDPKESWSLVAWCVYAAALHLRLGPTWLSRRWVFVLTSIFGFLAILFTFIGVNYILSGLHSYS